MHACIYEVLEEQEAEEEEEEEEAESPAPQALHQQPALERLHRN